ncbi:helix-turn-helix transcriptional regulator [Ferrovum sp.]|uniref:helix-turn-helix domain-containing protein n=1 Tax=Ferrovum sp. TaxID=2609467 RepID=UPI00262A06CA|nr:helix-turn-helix transcriptional regulator [Ferrovum sp.]
MARSWSQEVLAELAGLHRNYVGHVGRGEVNVGLENLMRLAGSLGVSVGKLVDQYRVGARD